MNIKGLTAKEARKRYETYGPNVLKEQRPPTVLERFADQMKDFMIITLLAAAAVSFILSLLGNDADYIDSIIILAIVIVNAVLGVFQEKKAEHSLAALKKLSAPTAEVIRDGVPQNIGTEQLVPGDVICLKSGNYIPADAKVLSSTRLQTEESALTGESVEIVKEKGDMVFSGTITVTGHGLAEITATGMATELGKIAGMLSNENTRQTPLQKKLSHIGKVLGILSLAICIAIFIIGILKRQPIFPMFMTSVSLAVAAIPEGLPAIVTIMLSLGVERMARRHAVIRKLPAVETLGSATVICSDKTGTLTENRMSVTDIFTYDKAEQAAKFGILCNHGNGGVEQALIRYGENLHLSQEKELNHFPLIDEIPFDSMRKCMTTLHRFGDGYLSVTKGAPEFIISHSSCYLEHGKEKPFTPTIRKNFLNANQAFAGNALRVLAVAYEKHSHKPMCTETSLERNLTLVALVACMDPPRKEAITAIERCKKAGIRPVMITGDHELTAAAAGKLLGFSDIHTVTGETLHKMSDHELYRNIYRHNIYARVLPADKVRLVKAFQAHGEVVAMTGDGVNDAPALKAADIGCAMGLGGTDVAKSASDMILTDDNFATIVAAVEEGRGIYDNIKKAIYFLLSCNIGEIMTIFVAILMGHSSPLLPVQLLFINLVTDSFPAICLGLEPPEKDIMTKPPRGHREGLFSGGGLFQIMIEGMFIGSLALTAYMIGGTTMCFAVLALSQIVHSFNMRSHLSLFKIGILSNPKLLLSGLLCLLLQISVIAVPFLQNIFHTTTLTFTEWGLVAFLSLLPIPLKELEKSIDFHR